MRRLILTAGALLALAACTAQGNADSERRVVCIDGVEYLGFPGYALTYSYTPHLKPDGKPYTCAAKIG